MQERLAALGWPDGAAQTLAWALAAVVAALVVFLVFTARARRRRRAVTPVDTAVPFDGSELPLASRTAPVPRLRTLLLGTCGGALTAAALFGVIVNVLMLTGAMFMLEVYDRVLPSRSIATLIGLCIIAAVLFTALGLIDVVRARIMTRVSALFDQAVARPLLDAVLLAPLRTPGRTGDPQPLRDLDVVRAFLSGPGPLALFDLPWLPFYLAVIFAFHPLLGVTALCGALVLIVVTAATELLMRRPIREATAAEQRRNVIATESMRNSEPMAAMGFSTHLAQRWASANADATLARTGAADVAGGLGALARVLRMVLQAAVLAVGAYLVINQQATGGIIIAGSVLAARALAPVDQAIASWRAFVAARQGWKRLDALLSGQTAEPPTVALPPPSRHLRVEAVTVVPPGGNRPVVRDVSFALERGSALAVIGPSGSGKTSLARVLVGAWLPTAGRVRLDGAVLAQYSGEARGRHVGYLPQDVGLFSGTIGQNIARLNPAASDEAVVAAARVAGAHDLIVGLAGEHGYTTEVGEAGRLLSAGQRQRVALARALYGDPFLVVLDEPDAALDQDGERALEGAIRSVRDRGGIAIVVSHRASVLAAVGHVLVMENGRAVAFGPRDSVLQRGRPPSAAVHILKSIPDPGRT